MANKEIDFKSKEEWYINILLFIWYIKNISLYHSIISLFQTIFI